MKKLLALLVAAGCLTSYNVMAEESGVEVAGRAIILSTGDVELDNELKKLPIRERKKEIRRIIREKEKAKDEILIGQEGDTDEAIQKTIDNVAPVMEVVEEKVDDTIEKVEELPAIDTEVVESAVEELPTPDAAAVVVEEAVESLPVSSAEVVEKMVEEGIKELPVTE